MRSHLFQPNLGLLHLAKIDFSAISLLRVVAFGCAQALDEAGFQLRSIGAKDLVGQLNHPAGVGDDLHRLDARDVVKEPSAAGVHQLCMALHLEQP